jgi:peptidyl-prolyl cis-trans isomerase A (cyclophilin A)
MSTPPQRLRLASDDDACDGVAASIVDVRLETHLGTIEMAIYANLAPLSAHAFLRLIDSGCFAQYGAFYRTVRAAENDRGEPPIDVIQGGVMDVQMALPEVAHESTERSGLRHEDGTVSLARGALGTASGAAFFICIGQQPSLDAGGRRNIDAGGFAAFGQVTSGMAIVRAIHRSATNDIAGSAYCKGQMLEVPVRIVTAERIRR